MSIVPPLRLYLSNLAKENVMTEGLLEEKKDSSSSYPMYDCLNVPIATGPHPVSRNECGWSISAKRFTQEQCYQVLYYAPVRHPLDGSYILRVRSILTSTCASFVIPTRLCQHQCKPPMVQTTTMQPETGPMTSKRLCLRGFHRD
jgi:hypothetical protein